MKHQGSPSASAPDNKRASRVLAAVGTLSAILTVFSFVTGWSNLKSFLRAMSPSADSRSEKQLARSVDLSSFVEGLSAREFTVALGGAAGDFEFSASGDVFYRGTAFRPRVHFTPDSTPEILVSIPDSGTVAAVVGLDSDGQRSFFLLHLDEGRGIFCNAPARDLYWSPDGRHLVALNVYEGQYFSSVDLETDAFKSSEFLGRKDTLWYVEGRAKWSPDGRALYAKVVEIPNVYEAEDPQRALDQTPLDTFLIGVDVESLAITDVSTPEET